MTWIELEVPLFPRTRRTADGTFYTHDGAGRIQVREHHVAEMLRYEGVRHRVPPPAQRQDHEGASESSAADDHRAAVHKRAART